MTLPRSSVWTLAQAERYLESLELFGMRFGLERMRRLMTALDSPHRAASLASRCVGTNGKSSTTRMIAAILERHGLRTGAYLSPHLASFAERIEIDERPLSDERFAAAVQRARARRRRSSTAALGARRARDAVRGADGGGLLGAGRARASRSRWSRPASAAATTPPA